MNLLDNVELDTKSFAYKDILAQDRWEAWTPNLSDWTLSEVGGPTVVTARKRTVGRQCFVQILIAPQGVGTAAATAGLSFITLPYTAAGLGGHAAMVDMSSMIAIGLCVIDATNSRIYVPEYQPFPASSNAVFIAGWFEC